ncbi:serine/threonine-protein kinase H1-like [Salvelinus fontinalis]|uniref:serine/threonine-protein kinase H1-like n=1 Tax=Salvelinus fontinalis TaxID=8038 RepID=UPI002485E050|nr:serine/threonine-protein kinase H1-like [Salvelinus fontinalis]
MGCGSTKVLPESSVKNGYVSFVKSVVGYSHKRKELDDELQKCKGTQKDFWSVVQSSGVTGTQAPSRILLPTGQDGQRHNRVAKYKAKFDPRVTARYDIKALIGRGSFSRVVRVEHRATRQPFAIKMMEVEAREGREVCDSELGVLRRVSHLNVVQLVEVFQSPQRVYMVLELATGGELFDRVIAKGHFTERDATRALQMTLAGVGYLHSLGITHRDLKPENLLYYHPGADSRLLVTDFGLASFGNKDPGGGKDGSGDGDGMGSGSGVGGCGVGYSGVGRGSGSLGGVPGGKVANRDGKGSCDRRDGKGSGRDGRGDGGGGGRRDWSMTTTCGTPEYMAPEVVLRMPYSCQVDMWALGVIAYILLSGSMPFEDDSRPRLYRAILRGRYSFHGEPWPSVSNLAKDFIECLLGVDPSSRLTAIQALHHPWVVTMSASSSSMTNLHRSISQNLRRRASRASVPSSSSSSRCPSSTGSGASHSRFTHHWEKDLLEKKQTQRPTIQNQRRQPGNQATTQSLRPTSQSNKPPEQVQPAGSTTTTQPGSP